MDPSPKKPTASMTSKVEDASPPYGTLMSSAKLMELAIHKYKVTMRYASTTILIVLCCAVRSLRSMCAFPSVYASLQSQNPIDDYGENEN